VKQTRGDGRRPRITSAHLRGVSGARSRVKQGRSSPSPRSAIMAGERIEKILREIHSVAATNPRGRMDLETSDALQHAGVVIRGAGLVALACHVTPTVTRSFHAPLPMCCGRRVPFGCLVLQSRSSSHPTTANSRLSRLTNSRPFFERRTSDDTFRLRALSRLVDLERGAKRGELDRDRQSRVEPIATGAHVIDAQAAPAASSSVI